MKVREIRNSVSDIWGPVIIKEAPIVKIKKGVVFLNNYDEPLFGDEVLEGLEKLSEETEVVLDWK